MRHVKFVFTQVTAKYRYDHRSISIKYCFGSGISNKRTKWYRIGPVLLRGLVLLAMTCLWHFIILQGLPCKMALKYKQPVMLLMERARFTNEGSTQSFPPVFINVPTSGGKRRWWRYISRT